MPPPPASPQRPSPGWKKPFASHLPRGTDPYALLAEVLKKLGREKELTPQRLEKLYAAEGSNAALGCFLAGQYARRKELDKAETLYLEVLEERPHGCRLHRN